MTAKVFPPDDLQRRLAALADYGVLDTPEEQGFDDIVKLACQVCRVPVSLVSLVAENRQWFKARVGFPHCETPLNQSVCAYALNEPELLVIPDLTADPRTSANTLVTQDPAIRFYAGAVLRNGDGVAIGSLCVIDTVPRPEGLTLEQADALVALARQVVNLLDLRAALASRDQAMEKLMLADQADRNHQKLVREELGHRLKNLLTIVQSLVGQTMRSAVTLDDARATILDRIAALSSAQDLLIEASNEQSDLETVVRAALAPYDSDNRFEIGGEAISLGPRSAMLLALTVHELATNAVKYGALSSADGRIAVRWHAREGRDLNLVWQERGGPPVQTPKRRGFGSRLIERALAAEMGGTAELAFAPGGLRFDFVAPLSVPAA